MALIYDLEIKKAIQSRNEGKIAGIQYCGGWTDYVNMGISVVCIYDTDDDNMYTLQPEASIEDRNTITQLIAKTDYIIGYNNDSFDNNVMRAAGFDIPPYKSYDLYVQIIKATGWTPGAYRPAGYTLDNVAKANGLSGKLSGVHGAHAPIMWQSGDPEQHKKLFAYCRQDVQATIDVCGLVQSNNLICPNRRVLLPVATPQEVLGTIQRGLF